MSDGGWFPDPDGSARLRWWDGDRWTEHVAEDPQLVRQQAHPVNVGQSASVQGLQGEQRRSFPRSSTLFAASSIESAPAGRMTVQNSAVIRASLGASLLVARGAMVAFQGDVQFTHEGSGVARGLKGMLSGESLALMRCAGRGDVFVSRFGRKLHLIDLDAGEQVSVSSKALLGFDDTVTWDVERIKAGVGAAAVGGLFNVTLTGPGTAILACDWPVMLDTSADRTLVDPNALVAWAAHLRTEVRTSFSGAALIGRGSGEAAQLEFSSGGWVIIQPEPPETMYDQTRQ